MREVPYLALFGGKTSHALVHQIHVSVHDTGDVQILHELGHRNTRADAVSHVSINQIARTNIGSVTVGPPEPKDIHVTVDEAVEPEIVVSPQPQTRPPDPGQSNVQESSPQPQADARKSDAQINEHSEKPLATDEPHFLTASQVMKMLNTAKEGLQAYIESGDLIPIQNPSAKPAKVDKKGRKGRRWRRFDRRQVDALIKKLRASTVQK